MPIGNCADQVLEFHKNCLKQPSLTVKAKVGGTIYNLYPAYIAQSKTRQTRKQYQAL